MEVKGGVHAPIATESVILTFSCQPFLPPTCENISMQHNNAYQKSEIQIL